jgi:hypothetical protein
LYFTEFSRPKGILVLNKGWITNPAETFSTVFYIVENKNTT